jgi:hypothetical protein
MAKPKIFERWSETRFGIEFQLALWAEDPIGWALCNGAESAAEEEARLAIAFSATT